MSQSPKPYLIFVPHYIGSFRYYEKLKPFLEDRYRVAFLISFVHEGSFNEMKQYSENRGYKTFLLRPVSFLSTNKKFGIFSYLLKLLRYRLEISRIFKEFKIAKVIAPNDSGLYSRYLFKVAKSKGAETLVLQWAMSYEGSRERQRKETVSYRKLLYQFLKPLYAFFKRSVARLTLGFGFDLGKDLVGFGNSDRMGVMNERALKHFLSNGVSPEKLSVVGYLDHYFAEAVKKELDQNLAKREAVFKKFGLDPLRKNIVFFSSIYSGKDLFVLSQEGQYEFTKKIFESIRKVCPESEHDLSLKIHPAEDIELYRPLEKMGVKIFGKDTDNYELIYCNDLYIAGGTATNFVPLIMGKDAIFINFLKLPVIEATKEVFNIKKFMTDYGEFENLLSLFKEGKLPKQYENMEGIVTKDSLSKIVRWIG